MASVYAKPVAAVILVALAAIALNVLQIYGIIPILALEIADSVYIMLVGIALYAVLFSLLARVSDEKPRFLLRKVAFALVAVFIIIGLLVVWVQELTYLALSIGLVAAGVTVALQQPIASLVGWLVLALEKPFSVGDRISINEVEGDVIDYGPFFIKIMEIRQWTEADVYTGRILMVPMNWILSYSVQNYSKDFPFIWDRIWIGLLHGVDFIKVREDIERIAQEQLSGFSEDAQKAYNLARKKYYLLEAPMDPTIYTSFDSNWIQLDLIYLTPFKPRRKTRSDLSSQILQYLNKNKITVASSSMNVNLMQALKEYNERE
jgi:small-conductance mechanosensitive channel